MEERKNKNYDRRPRQPRRDARPDPETAENLLEGRNALTEALAAGRAIGLTFPQIFFNILLPQAVVQMIPPWINSATEMIKASTLLGMIGVLDLLLVTRQIVAKYGEALVYYLIIGVFYFAINTLIEYAGKKLSKKLNYLQKAKR